METLLNSLGVGLILALMVWDVRHYRLPNLLTFLLAICGLALTWITAPELILTHTFAGIIGFSVFLCIHVVYFRIRGSNGLGIGDAKLLGAIGFWFGPFYLGPIVLVASIMALISSLLTRVFSDEAVTAFTKVPLGLYLGYAFLGTMIFKAIPLVR